VTKCARFVTYHARLRHNPVTKSHKPNRKLRTIHVRIDCRRVLGRRIQAARPGSTVVVRMRVVVTDKHENATAPRTMTLRVKV
jgi:hypothetical protein